MRAKPGTINHRSQSKRERFRQQVLAIHGPVCRMKVCYERTRRIDLTLKAPYAGSYSAEHLETVAELKARNAPPAAYFDPANGVPSHLGCNRRAGASMGGKVIAARKRAGVARRPERLERWRNPAY